MCLHAIYDWAPPTAAGVLLVMLPGAASRPQDLVDHGFVRALRERRLPVDVAIVDAHLGLYLDHSLSVRLTLDVIAPTRSDARRRLWLLGISLGGMGALIHVREHPLDVEGVILLAPFLGSRGTIAEVVRAGGLDEWRLDSITADDDERALLAWLGTYSADDRSRPEIHLGYGVRDRYAAASKMLAARLPPERVVTIDGEHEWSTWIALWQRMLDRGLFSGAEPAGACNGG